MHFRAATSFVTKKRLSGYYTKLCDDLIRTLKETGASGKDIFGHVLQEADTSWQVPPLEAPVGDNRTHHTNVLKEAGATLRWTVGKIEHTLPAWEEVANSIYYGTGKPVDLGRSYTAFNQAFKVSPALSQMMFSSPTLAGVNSLSYKVLFAAESAAFFAYVYGYPLQRGSLTYYVDTPRGTVGISSGAVLILSREVARITKQEHLGVALHLPRGEPVVVKAINAADAIRSWASVEGPEHADYILDVLSILKIGKAYAAIDRLSEKLLEMTPLKMSELKQFQRKVPVESGHTRHMRRTVKMEERELDYIKVQEILADPALVDKSKLWSIMEILVPKYMAQNSFMAKIGYPAGKDNVSAIFTKQKYDKMVSGWTKFRDASLEKARSKLNIKFEDKQ